jgi:hypothetical protein
VRQSNAHAPEELQSDVSGQSRSAAQNQILKSKNEEGQVKKWEYDEKPIREDVKLNLPDGWKLRVFQVTSGDSGKKYWVQLMDSAQSQMTFCNCAEGYFQLPLAVLGLKACCKHAGNLLKFLEEKESRRK